MVDTGGVTATRIRPDREGRNLIGRLPMTSTTAIPRNPIIANGVVLQTLLNNPPFGAGDGMNSQGDVLVNSSADGVDLQILWQEVNSALASWNAERGAVAQVLSFPTINAADAVPQSISDDSFELASEFGEPTSLRAPSNAILLGNTLLDWDRASRFSWKFLRDSSAEQIRAVTNYVLAADNKLTNGLIMQRLFDPSTETNEFGHTCYGLWSGDGMIPPAHLGKSFDGNHTHYLVSEAEVIDSQDLEDSIRHVQEHSYGVDPGSQLIAFLNPVDAEEVAAFRAGVVSNNEKVAKHDYIPSQGSPAYLQPDNIVGQVAPAQVNGLKINGSYGPLWIVESQYIPEKYLAVVATNGANSPSNAVSVRSHSNPAYRGLRTIAGTNPAYPLIESFYSRTTGVGTRHRGAAVVTQIKASGTYDVPSIAL